MSRVTQAPPAAIDHDNPWPGLASFTEEAKGFFFGREQETDTLLRLVRRQTLTVLFGQSGLGKSSLLQAGVFPALREADFLPLYLRLDHNPGAPPLADQVKSALVAAFRRENADAPTPRADETLWEYFHRKDIDIWSAKNRLLTPVLAFDQFEEIFTLGRAGEAARERSRALLSELACLVENRAPPAVQEKLDRGELEPTRFNFQKPTCQVILSLREDFLPDLEGLKQEMPALVHNRLRLKKLSGTQALEIVTKPAPHLLDEGVAEKIVEFVAGARGGSAERLAELDVEPPLLSVICRELNDRRRTLGQAQITADLVSGNRREILHDFYERSVGDLPEEVRFFVEDHLLTKSGFRDNLALESALEFPGVTRPLVDTLVSRRLLRIEERLGVQRVELTHDVLGDVVRASRDARRQRRAEAETLRRTKRLRLAIAGLAAVVLALSIGAVFGIRSQRLSARQAGHSDLLLGMRLLDEGKIADGLAYLVSAGKKDPANPVVAPRLLAALTRQNFFLPAGAPLSLPSPTVEASYSADGARLHVMGEDNVVRTIDARNWTLSREIRFEQPVRRQTIRFASGNGDAFVVTFADFSFRVYDGTTGQPSGPRVTLPAELEGQRFISPDGRWVVVTNRTDQLRIFEGATGKERAAIPVNRVGFRFSADSRRLLTASDTGDTLVWALPDGHAIGKPIPLDRSRFQVGRHLNRDGTRVLLRYNVGLQWHEVATGEPVGAFLDVRSGLQTLTSVSLDGSRIALFGTSNQVAIYDFGTSKPLYPPLEHGGPVLAANFSADERILFTNSVDGLFRAWDVETGRLLAVPAFQQEHPTPATASPDGRDVVAYGANNTLHRFRLGPGAAQPLVLPRHPDRTVMAIISRDAPAQLFWLGPDRVQKIDMASGRVVGGYTLPERTTRISMSAYAGALLGAGDTIPAVTDSTGLRAWTLSENGIVRDRGFTPDPGAAPMPSYMPKARHWPIVNNPARTIEVWDVQTGLRVQKLEIPGTSAGQLGFSPDESKLGYIDNTGTGRVYDVGTGKDSYTLRPDTNAMLRALRFTADGRHVLTGDEWGAVHIWEADTGKLVSAVRAHRFSVTRFDYTSDGSHFASVSGDGSVQVWNAKTLVRSAPPLVQNGVVGRATFSPDNTRIATPSSGGTARVWDVATGLPLTDALPHEGEFVGLANFSPDGRFISTSATPATGMSIQRLWSTPPKPERRTPRWLLRLATICACQRLNDDGKLVNAVDELAQFDELRREIAALPATDTQANWARWFLSNDPNRSIAPEFTITPAEAKKLREEFARPAAGGTATSASAP